MANASPLKKKLVVQGLTVLCFFFSMVAALGLLVYVREIFLSIGQDDKSLLFWYLPFLLFGLISAKLAIVTGVLAHKKRKDLV